MEVVTEKSSAVAQRDFILIDDSRLEILINTKVLSNSGLAKGVLTFKSGFDALEYLVDHSENPGTIIISDVQMPLLNGFDFVEEMEAHLPEKLKDISLYFLTASVREDDTAKFAGHPVVKGFLHKPFAHAVEELKEKEF